MDLQDAVGAEPIRVLATNSHPYTNSVRHPQSLLPFTPPPYSSMGLQDACGGGVSGRARYERRGGGVDACRSPLQTTCPPTPTVPFDHHHSLSLPLGSAAPRAGPDSAGHNPSAAARNRRGQLPPPAEHQGHALGRHDGMWSPAMLSRCVADFSCENEISMDFARTDLSLGGRLP